MIVLTFNSGPLAGQRQSFSLPVVQIGRLDFNEVRLSLPTVSGRHGRLVLENGKWLYQDLDSANGSRIKYADGRELLLLGRKRPPVEVGDGDRLVIENCEIEIGLRKEDSTLADLTIAGGVGPENLEVSDTVLSSVSTRTLKLLHRFMRHVASATDDQAVLQELAGTAVLLFDQARRAILLEVDAEERATVRFAVDTRGEPLPAGDLPISQTLVKRIIERQNGLIITNLAEEIPTASIFETNLRTVMAVPLWDLNRVVGIVLVDGAEDAAQFNPTDLQMLLFFVYHGSLAASQLRLIRELNRAFLSSVKALLRVLDMRDPHTSAHSLKVQALAMEIAVALHLPPERLEVVRYAALLHDIGKVGVPDEILVGKGKLSVEHRQVMNRHARHTKEILSQIDFPTALADVPNVAAGHHERLDGSGPLGLAAMEIPLESRILAVADVFEALTASRTYKELESTRETMNKLREMAGTHLDPVVIDALERALTL